MIKEAYERCFECVRKENLQRRTIGQVLWCEERAPKGGHHRSKILEHKSVLQHSTSERFYLHTIQVAGLVKLSFAPKVFHGFNDTLDKRLLTFAEPDSWVVVFLVWLSAKCAK